MTMTTTPTWKRRWIYGAANTKRRSSNWERNRGQWDTVDSSGLWTDTQRHRSTAATDASHQCHWQRGHTAARLTHPHLPTARVKRRERERESDREREREGETDEGERDIARMRPTGESYRTNGQTSERKGRARGVVGTQQYGDSRPDKLSRPVQLYS